jgi:hypothetical protein
MPRSCRANDASIAQAIEFVQGQNDEELWEARPLTRTHLLSLSHTRARAHCARSSRRQDLITHCLAKPPLVPPLLEHIGAYVNPLKALRPPARPPPASAAASARRVASRVVWCHTRFATTVPGGFQVISRIPAGMEIPGLREKLRKIIQDYLLQLSLREGACVGTRRRVPAVPYGLCAGPAPGQCQRRASAVCSAKACLWTTARSCGRWRGTDRNRTPSLCVRASVRA